MIKVKDGYIELDAGNDFKYDFKLSDCKTPEGLSAWLKHLNEKIWFKKSMERELIEICETTFEYKFTLDRTYN
jgi:hypothetical protein